MMDFSIDGIIFICFLIATIVIGLKSSRGTNTIKQYAIGDRNFSTATIVATIVATWVSGEFFYTGISETYANGLYSIWAIELGDFICLLIMGLFFIPRMGEFLGNLSIAEALGNLYGKQVRIITSIVSFIGTAGVIAIQLKLAGVIFEYALGIPSKQGVLISTFIVTLYSALGGIKSVTFTDVLQFLMFGVAIPLSAYMILTTIDSTDIITNTLMTNALFDYRQVFDFSNPIALKHLSLFLFCIIPGFSPQYFQRIAIAKNTKQASNAFIISAFVCAFLGMIIDWVSILTLSIDPSLSSTDAVKYVIFNSSYIGYKGVMLAGIMAMIMSTVDSCINSAAVIVVHDFFKTIKPEFVKNEVYSARFVAIIIGAASLILSLHEGSLLELLVITYSFYIPIVSTPFLASVVGFRSSGKSVMIGMAAGLSTVIIWDYILKIEAVNSIFLGMVGNLIFLFGSHYLLKQPGGWVGVKDQAPLIALRLERKMRWERFMENVKNFDFIKLCRINSPKSEGLFSILGFFVLISAFGSAHTLLRDYQIEYAYLIDVLYPLTLLCSSALISYPLWLSKWKEANLIGIIWNIIMFGVLICFSFLMVLMSNFSEIQLMVFMVNLVVLSSLVRWNWALFNIILGVSITSLIYHQFIHVDLEVSLISSEFKIIYLLMLIISTLVIFLKPKQEYQQLTEQKNEHLSLRLMFQEQELREALGLKSEFLRNINHEYHTPMLGIVGMSEVLHESYDQLTDSQRKKAIETIFKSSSRLECFDNNISVLSKISKGKLLLDKKENDLSRLVYERVNLCQKLYDEHPENHEIILNIGENINYCIDKYYMTKAIDNLIMNSLQYCFKGKIEIQLENEEDQIIFRIIDEGIGIPQNELQQIFCEFKVSSKTHSKAGGRGIGLTVAQKIIELHRGKIWAESDGKKGAKFIFSLPK